MYRWFHFTLQKKFSEAHLPKTKVLKEQCNNLSSDLLGFFHVNINTKAINSVIYPVMELNFS